MHKDEVVYLLHQINDAIDRIRRNMAYIHISDEFTSNPDGELRLESTCMLLLTIGECLKGIDKMTNNKLLSQYPEVDWKGAKGLRDIIAHKYFDIDTDIVYDVAMYKISPMQEVIKQIIKDLSTEG